MIGIRRLDARLARHIAAVQHVQGPCEAVQELIENALDAGATNISIHLQDHGLLSIEVSDNGHGLCEEDLKMIGEPYVTSKRPLPLIDANSTSNSTSNLPFYGFRGSALHALCMTSSKVVIISSTKETTPRAFRLELMPSNATEADVVHVKQVAFQPCARQMGTTVIVYGLLEPLAVRRKALISQKSRHFTATISRIRIYALIRGDVQWSVSHQLDKKERRVLFATQSKRSDRFLMNLEDSYEMVNRSSLLELDDTFELTLIEDDEIRNGPSAKLQGYVSRPVPHCGRLTADRQQLFIQKRPTESPKLMRMLNESYRTFNQVQYPCIWLSLQLPEGYVDMNAEPDKRRALVHHEQDLFEKIRKSVYECWIKASNTFPIHQESTKTKPQVDENSLTELPMKTVSAEQIQSISSFGKSHSSCSKPVHSNRTNRIENPIENPIENATENDAAVEKLLAAVSKEGMKKSNNERLTYLPPTPEPTQNSSQKMFENSLQKLSENQENSSENQENSSQNQSQKRMKTEKHLPVHYETLNKKVKWSLNLENIEKAMKCAQFNKVKVKNKHSQFLNEESNENRNENDTNEESNEFNSRLLEKAELKQLLVIGQFNRGFIIAKDSHSLYLIDQHAADEKSTFERLKRHARAPTQRLIAPQKLPLDWQSLQTAYLHRESIRRLGFDLQFSKEDTNIDHHFTEEADQVKSAFLLTAPVVQKQLLDAKDVLDIVASLHDVPCTSHPLSCPRLDRALASRACRTSVMIGTVLTRSQMTRIVHRLAELEQPWNCPHGRPTLRHLVDL